MRYRKILQVIYEVELALEYERSKLVESVEGSKGYIERGAEWLRRYIAREKIVNG